MSSRWVPTARGRVACWVSGTGDRDRHAQTRDPTVTRLSQALLPAQVCVVYNQSCQNGRPLGITHGKVFPKSHRADTML